MTTLHAEMSDQLKNQRHSPQGRGSENSRNETFDPVTVPKGVRRLTDTGDMLISLFSIGMTTVASGRVVYGSR